MSTSFNFDEKVVIVTGSSSGIGAATAVLFAKAGAYVVVTGRNAVNVSAVAKQCNDVSPKKSMALEVIADVTIKEDLKQLIDITIETFGKLDILVNNAGQGVAAEVTDPDYYEKFRLALDINLNSAVYLTHLSVNHLERTKGTIINVSSVAALRSGTWAPAYNVAKAGLDMFTRCMAAELGPKRIRVNVINPGAVSTNFYSAMGWDTSQLRNLYKEFGDKLPTGFVADGDHIAYAILFLASEESSYITGSNLVIDGGYLAANVSDD